MGKKTKYRMFFGLMVVLVGLLVAGACAPAAAPTDGEGAAEIAALEAEVTDLEGDVAAEKAKAKKLQDEIATLKKPAKVYRWEPAVWINAGTPWDFLVYLSEYLNEESDGRIESTPSLVGAVAPAEELMEVVSAGTTQAMLPTPSYYAGKVPIAAVYNTSIGLPSALDMYIAYETFEGGRAFEIYTEVMEGLYNVHIAGQRIGPVEAIISSRIPINRITDLEGMKFRSGDDHFAGPLAALGASTVWAPGSEIYTMLATGVVDAFTYGSAYDHYGMSFNEVTSYWVRSSIMAANNEQFVVNRDIWNEMPDDLKKMVEVGIYSANMRTIGEAYPIFAETWVKVEEEGITIIDWPEEDIKEWVSQQRIWLKQYESDPTVAEFVGIIARYGEMIGL